MTELLWGGRHKRWKAVMYTVALILAAYASGYGPPDGVAMALIGLVGGYVGGQSYTDGRALENSYPPAPFPAGQGKGSSSG